MFKLVGIGVTAEGSEALPFGPKNHSKVAKGTIEDGWESISVAEHVREKIHISPWPAVFESDWEMFTLKFMIPKFTVKTINTIKCVPWRDYNSPMFTYRVWLTFGLAILGSSQ